MSKKVSAEQIRDFAKSLGVLLKAFTSQESKQSGFATIEDYVDATRYRTESIDASRAEYYTFALNKLREQISNASAAIVNAALTPIRCASHNATPPPIPAPPKFPACSHPDAAPR